MTPQGVVDIAQSALWLMIGNLLPILVPALIVGLIIAIFQSLTQIQEMTLTFAPKIIVVFIALIISFPKIIQNYVDFTVSLFDKIVQIG